MLAWFDGDPNDRRKMVEEIRCIQEPAADPVLPPLPPPDLDPPRETVLAWDWQSPCCEDQAPQVPSTAPVIKMLVSQCALNSVIKSDTSHNIEADEVFVTSFSDDERG